MAARQKRHKQDQGPTTTTEEDRRGMQRWVNSFLYFWNVYEASACKRRRGCAGDPHACFERWWPVVPEAVKVEYRATIKAYAAGASAEEAVRAGQAEVERSAPQIAYVEAQLARLKARAPVAPTPARPREPDPPPPDPPSLGTPPRVRTL